MIGAGLRQQKRADAEPGARFSTPNGRAPQGFLACAGDQRRGAWAPRTGISRPAPAGNGRSDARLAAAQPERRIISTPLPGLTFFGHDAGNRKRNPLKPTAVVKAMVCSGADVRPPAKNLSREC